MNLGMSSSRVLDYIFSGDWMDTVLPDFVLSFTLFTALIYAVLGRRLGEQRPAIAASAALGAALSAGLVWWEQANGLSIRDLGPIAVGFAMILLAGVIHQSIRHVGGNWAAAGIALGACILVGWTMGVDWPVEPEIMQTIAGAALTLGIAAFLIHRKPPAARLQARHSEFPQGEGTSATMLHNRTGPPTDRVSRGRGEAGLRVHGIRRVAHR